MLLSFSEETLQKTLAENLRHIITSLTNNKLDGEMISVCKERQILNQVDAICNNSNEMIITHIGTSVLNGDMRSILNFVYALFVVGEKKSAFQLLQTPTQGKQYQSVNMVNEDSVFES